MREIGNDERCTTCGSTDKNVLLQRCCDVEGIHDSFHDTPEDSDVHESDGHGGESATTAAVEDALFALARAISCSGVGYFEQKELSASLNTLSTEIERLTAIKAAAERVIPDAMPADCCQTCDNFRALAALLDIPEPYK